MIRRAIRSSCGSPTSLRDALLGCVISMPVTTIDDGLRPLIAGMVAQIDDTRGIELAAYLVLTMATY